MRVNRLEEALRQANGRIEELENAQHRLESAAAEVPPGRRIPVRRPLRGRVAAAGRRRSARQPRPSRQRPPRPRKSDAFDPNADPNAPGAPRPLGTTPPSAPLVRESPAPLGAAAARSWQPPLELGKAAARRASGPTIVGSGVAMLDQPREQFNAALAGLSSRAISGGGSRVQVVSRRQSRPSAERRTRSSISARPIFSARARARRPNNISK